MDSIVRDWIIQSACAARGNEARSLFFVFSSLLSPVLIDRAQLIGLFHASAEQIKSDASVIPFAAALARYNRSVVRKIILLVDRLERIARRLIALAESIRKWSCVDKSKST